MSRWSNLTLLAAAELRATPGRSLISSLGIGLGVSVLLVVAGLGLGARDVILEEVVRTLPMDMIEVRPKTLDLGLFKTTSLFGEESLGPETAEALGRLSAVEAVYPKLEVKLPLGARGGRSLFGRGLYTDLFMEGLPEALVSPEAPEFHDDPEVIRVVISEQLIEIYNQSVASTLGTPRLTVESLKGFEFEIVVGRSLMLGTRGARTAGVEKARIVGASRYALRLGVSVPTATAQRLLEKYGGEPGDPGYAALLVKAASPKQVPEVAEAVSAMGLAVDETAERTADMLNAATALASLVGVLVLILAALNIAHSFLAALTERRRELAILRAVGARSWDLVVLVETQAVILGAGGGLLGIGAAHLFGLGLDMAAGSLLPDFPFKPDSFVAMPLWLDGVGFAAAVLAAGLGAFGSAVRAARAPLAEALSET